MKISLEDYQAQAREEALDILDEAISYLKKADERKLVMKLRDVENYIRFN